LIARRTADVSAVLRAIVDLPASEARYGTIGVLAPRFHVSSSAEICAFHQVAIAALEAEGFRVEVVDPGFDPPAVIADHRVVMLFEAARQHGRLLAEAPQLLGPMIRAGLAEGSSISDEAATAARIRIERTRERV